MTDPSKVQAIIDWPTLDSFFDMRSFHGLATFYRRFIHGFSTIIATIIKYLKAKTFAWSFAVTKAFEKIKQKMSIAPVLKLLNFSKIFEVAYDALYAGIDGVLSKRDTLLHP